MIHEIGCEYAIRKMVAARKTYIACAASNSVDHRLRLFGDPYVFTGNPRVPGFSKPCEGFTVAGYRPKIVVRMRPLDLGVGGYCATVMGGSRCAMVEADTGWRDAAIRAAGPTFLCPAYPEGTVFHFFNFRNNDYLAWELVEGERCRVGLVGSGICIDGKVGEGIIRLRASLYKASAICLPPALDWRTDYITFVERIQ